MGGVRGDTGDEPKNSGRASPNDVGPGLSALAGPTRSVDTRMTVWRATRRTPPELPLGTGFVAICFKKFAQSARRVKSVEIFTNVSIIPPRQQPRKFFHKDWMIM